MKNINRIFVALVMVTLLGCRPDSDTAPQTENPPGPPAAAKPPASTDRVTAQEKLYTKLNELDTAMADLKARAQRAGDQAKAEWEARRPELEVRRQIAAKELEELKQASQEGWEATRTKTEAALVELEKGFKEAWAKLKE